FACVMGSWVAEMIPGRFFITSLQEKSYRNSPCPTAEATSVCRSRPTKRSAWTMRRCRTDQPPQPCIAGNCLTLVRQRTRRYFHDSCNAHIHVRSRGDTRRLRQYHAHHVRLLCTRYRAGDRLGDL